MPSPSSNSFNKVSQKKKKTLLTKITEGIEEMGW